MASYHTCVAMLNKSGIELNRGVLVHRFLGALLFTNLEAPKVRRTEQKCAERSLDQDTQRTAIVFCRGPRMMTSRPNQCGGVFEWVSQLFRTPGRGLQGAWRVRGFVSQAEGA